MPEAWTQDDALYDDEQPQSYRSDQRHEIATPYYGFQHVDMVTGHGDRCGGHYQQWFQSTYPDWRELSDPANELPHNYACPQSYRTPIPEDAYPTTWVADRAIDYVTAAADNDDPFFAFVSFPDPHHPFNPPGRYWDMYAPDQFEIDLPFEAHQNPTPPMRFADEICRSGHSPQLAQIAFRTEDAYLREAMALTAGMITMVDDQIGRVLQALDSTGQMDNTIIIFTSDHGDFLGDFSLLLKGPLHFPAVTRVPMIWSDPGMDQVDTSSALASTIDIGASLLDRVGLQPYNGMQGQSFAACLEGQANHRDEVFIEHNDSGPRLGFTQPARLRTIRDKSWRFTTYGGESWGELYDLINDPNETHNLWDDPAHADTKAELSLRLIAQLTAQMDESPLSTRLA